LPPPTLERGDVNSFLEFLFADICRRPVGFTLRETAGVVQYLRLLAAQGVPAAVLKGGTEALRHFRLGGRGGTEADTVGWLSLERLAKIVWGDLLIHGRIRPSRKSAALAFLRRHEDNYQMSPELKPALKFVQDYDLPADFVNSAGPPNLKSTHRSVHGQVKTRRQTDLSERVFAACYALSRTGVRNRNVIIAKALTTAEVKAGRKSSGTRSVWSWDDVKECIKSYERSYELSQRKLLAKTRASKRSVQRAVKRALKRHRVHCADAWIAGYRYSRSGSPRE
jgi:hypothetical protein